MEIKTDWYQTKEQQIDSVEGTIIPPSYLCLRIKTEEFGDIYLAAEHFPLGQIGYIPRNITIESAILPGSFAIVFEIGEKEYRFITKDFSNSPLLLPIIKLLFYPSNSIAWLAKLSGMNKDNLDMILSGESFQDYGRIIYQEYGHNKRILTFKSAYSGQEYDLPLKISPDEFAGLDFVGLPVYLNHSSGFILLPVSVPKNQSRDEQLLETSIEFWKTTRKTLCTLSKVLWSRRLSGVNESEIHFPKEKREILGFLRVIEDYIKEL